MEVKKKKIIFVFYIYFKGNYFNCEIKEIICNCGVNYCKLLFRWFILIIIFIVCKCKFLNLYSFEY